MESKVFENALSGDRLECNFQDIYHMAIVCICHGKTCMNCDTYFIESKPNSYRINNNLSLSQTYLELILSWIYEKKTVEMDLGLDCFLKNDRLAFESRRKGLIFINNLRSRRNKLFINTLLVLKNLKAFLAATCDLL